MSFIYYVICVHVLLESGKGVSEVKQMEQVEDDRHSIRLQVQQKMQDLFKNHRDEQQKMQDLFKNHRDGLLNRVQALITQCFDSRHNKPNSIKLLGEQMPVSWLPKGGKIGRLLYRMTTDLSTHQIHGYCSNKGSTLIIVKDKKGNVFGGCLGVDWTGKGDRWKRDPSAFLFVLKCNAKQCAIKLPFRRESDKSKRSFSHYDRKKFGLIFHKGFEIFREGCCRKDFGSSVWDAVPELVNKTGWKNGEFTPDEVEIYQIIKNVY